MRETDFSCRDRRSRRSQCALADALADLLAEGKELSRLTVSDLTNCADLTRRTFYSHYRDIPDFVDAVETILAEEIGQLIHAISEASLPQVYSAIKMLEPAPGSVELVEYLAKNKRLVGGLLGPGGDPGFIKRLTDMACLAVSERMQTGIPEEARGVFFDYYLSYVVAAEAGVVQRWFETGLAETPETIARIMTVIAFVRPGDLYGMPIDIDVPAYGMRLMGLATAGKGDL
ncbi:TetR family transcriptional regulator C-terminal domain-containing protein [Collinsella sp. AGMB00827]|uniref:TetR family transcriptional regulator C-terminal domain-containing protein n=2 Tax=Collinsella ureilytica TaxID=2869515 RepID=A0ABS7MLG9_9ACTN|nr:TetR family transcriptional regulator C-terminal domain-containing protein [Collinsella urealyticum]